MKVIVATGCEAPGDDAAGTPSIDSAATRVDSARAGQLALDAMRRGSTGGLRVVEVKRDGAGYLVTIFSDPLAPGGGGRVRVTVAGRVTVLERFQ
jgi:hypothetical protein